MIQRRSYQLILVFAILSFVGVALLGQLAVQLSPNKSSGSIVISYVLPYASPEVLEQQLTAKMEGALSTLQGIKKITSRSEYSTGYITLDLEKQTDIDQLRFEVAMLIRQLFPKFPKDASYPTIQLNSPEESTQQTSFMTLQLSGNEQPEALSRYVEEQVKPKLGSIKGIYEVTVYGGNKLEWVVSYDKNRLDALNIKETDITNAIDTHFKEESIGVSKNTNGQSMNVVLKNEDTTEWKIPIENHSGRIIFLTDIAKIYKQQRPVTAFYRINGNNALNLILVANKGANQLRLSKEVRKHLTEIRQKLPHSYQLTIEQDASEYIAENLEKTGIQAVLAVIILLVFVAFSVRKWWYVALISVSLFVNLALSIILFYVFNIEIHLYSLAALTTSLGIIIDNTIVMIDHYQRYRNLKIFMGLLGATLTTIAGLVVIFFLPEENRIELTDFSLVMLITLLVSLLVALFFVPAVMERLKKVLLSEKIKNTKPLRQKVKMSRFYLKSINILQKYRKTAYLIAILGFGTPIFLLPSTVEETNFGANFYNKIMTNEWFQEKIRPVLNTYLGGTLRLFAQYVYESSYYQSPERTVLYVYAGLPLNSAIEQMDGIFRQVENKVNQFREIDKAITTVYDAQNGMMSIYFTPEAEENGFPYRMKSAMIQFSTEMSGIDWDIYGIGQGFSQSSSDTESPTFTVKMMGYNYNELERQATALKGILEKHPRIQEVNINKSTRWENRKNLFEYTLKTDNKLLAIKEINKNKLSEQLTQQSSQPKPDLYVFIDNDYFPLKVIPSESYKKDNWQVENQLLKQDSVFIRIKDISKIIKAKISPEITKENQQYIRIISFTYFGSSTFGNKFLDKTISQFNPKMPIGYKAEKQEHNWMTEHKETKFWLIGLVILLIYIICAIIFESFLQPLALILLIPLSFIGVFLAFYCFDFNFDQGGYASFILLSGNVVCAAIFIITEFNLLRKKAPNLSETGLYVKAFNHKFTPILSTILSTIVGLIPFLIYGQKEAFWFAFGVGTIGGLTMSLFIIPIYLPLFLCRR
jgi:multidrug efflux pump subunit AcrB